MKNYIIIGILLLAVSCTKKDHGCPESDYFIFGDAYGFCGGDCANLYLIERNKVYADNINSFYVEPLRFETTALPDIKYQSVKTLPIQLPQYLWSHVDTSFGCPDCMDQGLIYVEYRLRGVVGKWRFDRSIGANPPEVQPYLQVISDKLEELR